MVDIKELVEILRKSYPLAYPLNFWLRVMNFPQTTFTLHGSARRLKTGSYGNRLATAVIPRLRGAFSHSRRGRFRCFIDSA